MSAASALPRQEPASPAMLRAPIAMTKWRGHSGCTYVAVIHDLSGDDLATMGECVVLGAARTSSGIADLLGAAVSSPTAARSLAARFAKRGATEMHVIHAADTAAGRTVIASDLQP
ncbi:hypothetical protein [Methylobacterium hispanicum]|uniref:hypothetical protein n=1 Tax=Methylobacterium hispanicum TaxID=270350 RepID=UPI002F323FB5